MQKYSYSISEVYSSYELNNRFNLMDLVTKQNNKGELVNILRSFNIDPSIIDDNGTQITIRLDEDNSFINLPLVSSKYYDESDSLFSNIKLNGIDSKIESFSGEIYEQLNFERTDLNSFLKDNNYQQYIYPETKSCIHFKGVEWNLNKLKDYNNMKEITLSKDDITKKSLDILNMQKEKCKETKELYITKDDKIYTMYYNAPYIYDVKKVESGFNVDEINSIIERINDLLKLLEQSEEKDKFLLYVIGSLRQYEKTILNRGFRGDTLLNDKTIRIIEECVVNNKKNKNNIYFKIKIVSNEPVKLISPNEKTLLKK